MLIREDAKQTECYSQARARLGAHAGLLQQFLFHAARVGAIELTKEGL